MNTVDHYKNIHTSCHESSRCRKDKNYEIVITEPLAEKLLANAILSSNIYKHPEDYIYGRDTFYVESFNNVINVYKNKRIAFGDEQYNTRNNLAVCHWNENVDREHTSVSNPQNVDREHTSVSNPQNARRPRSKRKKEL